MMCRYDLPYAFNKPSLYITFFIRIFFCLFVFIVFSLLADTVSANVADVNNKPDLNKTTHGSVWLLPRDGIYIEALQLETRVNMDVSGMIVRAKVKQQFRNVSSLWAEGLYVFPLPENAAVDHFRMLIDGRVIEGQIQEKMQARRTYEKAKRNGQRTGLVEQQRANIFTTKLANIAPGAKVTVEIEYQQALTYRDGHYALRYPLVVGERYITPAKALRRRRLTLHMILGFTLKHRLVPKLLIRHPSALIWTRVFPLAISLAPVIRWLYRPRTRTDTLSPCRKMLYRLTATSY